MPDGINHPNVTQPIHRPRKSKQTKNGTENSQIERELSLISLDLDKDNEQNKNSTKFRSPINKARDQIGNTGKNSSNLSSIPFDSNFEGIDLSYGSSDDDLKETRILSSSNEGNSDDSDIRSHRNFKINKKKRNFVSSDSDSDPDSDPKGDGLMKSKTTENNVNAEADKHNKSGSESDLDIVPENIVPENDGLMRSKTLENNVDEEADKDNKSSSESDSDSDSDNGGHRKTKMPSKNSHRNGNMDEEERFWLDFENRKQYELFEFKYVRLAKEIPKIPQSAIEAGSSLLFSNYTKANEDDDENTIMRRLWNPLTAGSSTFEHRCERLVRMTPGRLKSVVVLK